MLLEKSIALAKTCKYNFIRLDTLNHMTPAINLYKKYGFYEIAAYYHNPVATAVYFEKKLQD
jgi:putative acetyltransferase